MKEKRYPLKMGCRYNLKIAGKIIRAYWLGYSPYKPHRFITYWRLERSKIHYEISLLQLTQILQGIEKIILPRPVLFQLKLF